MPERNVCAIAVAIDTHTWKRVSDFLYAKVLTRRQRRRHSHGTFYNYILNLGELSFLVAEKTDVAYDVEMITAHGRTDRQKIGEPRQDQRIESNR